MQFEPIIGLEVHCQLATRSKLFCSCATTFGVAANHQVCPVCLGMPGTLPVINTLAVDYAVRLALAVGAKLNTRSIFSRKQYFYPDLPKGYQITQYDQPYCEGGEITVDQNTRVRLTRIHLEEDAGKNLHGPDASYCDYNRAGMPLVEIVSQPEIGSAVAAADYLRSLRSLVRHLGISDGNLEEGSFRCDANVSLRLKGTSKLGTRCEIKNLNSFRNVERAINYEIQRQGDILEQGGKIVQHTLLFDADSGRTAPMRAKEESHDYRYIPDPDLPPLCLSADRIEKIRKDLPELPQAMAARFIETYSLPDSSATLLTSDRDLAAYFESVNSKVDGKVATKIVANWVIGEFLPVATELNWDLAKPNIDAAHLAGLLILLGDDVISSKIAKNVFEEMVKNGESAPDIVERLGLTQVTDQSSITALIDQVIEANPDQLRQFLSGKEKIFGFFVGQVMKLSHGKMNPALVNSILTEKLAQRRE
ncbi:MAG: Asp-tRNA(Asn)/Glu-tRNA(Gln) amidotransferase subunit GatB [Proteobacteria bacterium]|nr:Asp-tRNA(Asn)/Glu-tRNA(Gln) amidotransferase subunit GatB [Pseudomonadota bacterium]